MGAWDQMYQKGTHGDASSPVGYGCIAVKRELAYNSLGTGIDAATPEIGVPAARQIVAFQTANALTPDGIVGPITARVLFRRREFALERAYAIPDHLLCRVTSLESDHDPAAVGVADPNDHGLVQINALAHPTVTLAEAFDAAFSLGYLASSLQTMFLKLQDWDCAVAAWNVGGGGASDWCGLGKPTTGGPPWFPSLFERATQYTALVKAQAC